MILNFDVCDVMVEVQSLDSHLAKKGVAFIPISTPPVLSVSEFGACSGWTELKSVANSMNLDLFVCSKFYDLFVWIVRKFDNFCLSGSDSGMQSFSMRKKTTQMQHRQKCLSTIERIFGDGPTVEGDLIVINFFALVLLILIGVLDRFLVKLITFIRIFWHNDPGRMESCRAISSSVCCCCSLCRPL